MIFRTLHFNTTTIHTGELYMAVLVLNMKVTNQVLYYTTELTVVLQIYNHRLLIACSSILKTVCTIILYCDMPTLTHFSVSFDIYCRMLSLTVYHFDHQFVMRVADE